MTPKNSRGAIVVLVAILALTLTATAALAVAAKFHAASAAVASNGALAVSFDERGLGEGDVDYRLTADATATWACFNRGGKNPSAANKRDISFPVVATTTLEAKNGRISATLTSGAPSPQDFSCPGGQVLRLASIAYSNILLEDLTNGSSVNLGSESRTFFTV